LFFADDGAMVDLSSNVLPSRVLGMTYCSCLWRDDGLGADGDRGWQVFAPPLGMANWVGDVVLRHWLDAEPIGLFHLQTIALRNAR
jgi:hypothetical protein